MITTFLTRDRVVVTDYQNRRYPIDEENVDNPAVILYDERDGGAERTLRALDTEYEKPEWPGTESIGRSATTAWRGHHSAESVGRSRPPRMPRRRT